MTVRFVSYLCNREVAPLQEYREQHMRLPSSRTLRRRPRPLHPIFRRAPRDGIIGLRNPAPCDPVRERGDQVFRERPHATTGLSDDTTAAEDFFPNDDYFPSVDNF